MAMASLVLVSFSFTMPAAVLPTTFRKPKTMNSGARVVMKLLPDCEKAEKGNCAAETVSCVAPEPARTSINACVSND